MALDRFKKFQDTLAQPDPDVASDGSPVELRIHEHGPLPVDRPSYVRGFLRKAWRVTLVGALGAGALSWMNDHGAAVVGPLIGDTPYDASINATYQFVERTVLGKQGALDQQKRELDDLSARWQAGGVFTVKPTLSVSYYHDGASDALSRVDGTCTVEMSMDENGRMTALGLNGGIDRSNDPEAIRNHRNYIFGHESAHCSFHRELAPFRGSGLSPAAEKFLNDWVFGASADNGNNPIRSMFNETEADVMGELVMLQAARYDEKAWQEVERDWSARTNKQRYEEAQQYPLFFDPHETAPALREMLDNRDVVERLNPAEFRNYAYAVASRSVMVQLSSYRVRAMPETPINTKRLLQDDPLRHGRSNVGALGWEILLHRINPVEMRITVSEQALQMREEQLGLRTPIQGMGDTLPRRMAQQWVAQAQPFKTLINDRPAVTFVNTPDGPERQWAGKDGLDGKKVFYSRAGGAPSFRDRTAYQTFQQQVHWDAIVSEIQHALKADPASLTLATNHGPTPVVVDLGLAKADPSLTASKTAPTEARLQANAPRALPTREQLGRRLDEAANKVHDTVMPPLNVARITARRPA